MKKVIVFIINIILFFAIATNVYAVENLELKTTKDKVNLGEEFIISLDLNSDNKEKTSLYAYTARLSYDKDVFDVIDESNFEESENWSDITYNASNNKFALINKKGELDENFLQIKLKVKENATPGNTTIAVNGITASDGKNDVQIESKKVDVMVVKDGLEKGESIPASKTSEIAEETTNIEVGKDRSWIAYVLIALIVVIFAFTIYYYINSKKKDTPQNKRMAIVGGATVILILLLIIAISLLSNKKADVNKDGQVDYDDANDIIEYLLEIKNPEEDENLSDKDINNDGQVTIGDVAASVNQATNQNYTASITGTNSNGNSNTSGNTNNTNNTTSKKKKPSKTDKPSGSNDKNKPNTPSKPNTPNTPNTPSEPDEPSTPSTPDTPDEPSKPEEEQYSSVIGSTTVSNLTPEKGEEITLDLYIDVTPYTEIKAVEIEGKTYKVAKIKDTPVRLASIVPVKAIATNIANGKNNHYSVTIPAPTTAGVHDIHITKVELDNGKKVNVDYIVKVDVLKDAPKVESFKVDGKKTVPEVSFEFIDPDGALKEAKFVIKDEKGKEVFSSKNIKVGYNSFAVELEDGNIYHYDLEIDYDLDHDYFNKGEAENFEISKDFIDTLLSNKDGDLKFTALYGFTSKNMELSSKVSSDSEMVLSFENGEDSYYDVKSVVINGKEYNVVKENGKYIVKNIEKGGKGNNTVTVERIILENGEEYEINEKYDYTYLRDVPIFGDSIKSEVSDSKLKLTLDIDDPDSTLKDITVYLTDENGNTVANKTLKGNENYVEFELNESGRYKARVEYTYEVEKGVEQTGSKEYTDTFGLPIKMTIVSGKLTKATGEEIEKYVEKSEELIETFTIQTNTKEKITYITVNGVKCQATENKDGTYTVRFNAPDKTGETSIQISGVEFETSGDVDVTYSTDIEVLKSEKPVIDGISVVKSGDTPVVAFVVTDPESTFLNGHILITKTSGETVYENTFDSIHNTSFNLDGITIEDFKDYNIKIEVNYDLDTDNGNGKNEGTVVKEDSFEILGDYTFGVEDFTVQSIDKENNKVILQITTSITEGAEDDFSLTKVVINDVTYNVMPTENNKIYTVEVPYETTSKQDLMLQEAIMSDSQGFGITDKKVTIFKTAPTAEVYSTVLRDATQDWLRDITVSVRINDIDQTIKNKELHARLLDSENKKIAEQKTIIDEEILHDKTTELHFESELPYTAGIYTVEVYADYDIADGNVYDDETIGTAKVTALKYATIESVKPSKEYVNKNDEFEIIYEIKSNTEEDPTAIEINGQDYNLTKNTDGTYKVIMTAPDKAGIMNYNSTRLIYSDSQVSAQSSAQVDVLKNVKPTVNGLSVNDDDLAKPVLSFNLVDPEDTFVKGQITITREGQEPITIAMKSKDDTNIELQDIQKSQEYNVEVEITYDLDSNKNNEEHQSTEKLAEGTIEIEDNYNFEISNYKLQKIDTDKKIIVLEFVSTNESEKYDIKSVMINNSEYPVEKGADNKYTVKVPYTEPERQELELQKVILNNSKGFSDFELEKVIVFKEEPKATLEANVSEDLKTIRATFGLTDNEVLIQELEVQLLNESGEVVDTQTINRFATEIVFNNKNDTEYTEGNYTIKVQANYDTANGEAAENKVLVQTNAKVAIKVKSVEAKPQNNYVAKNGQIKIVYTIDSNTEREVQDFIINNEVVVPEKTEDGKYMVAIQAPQNYGAYDCTLSEIVYKENERVETTNTAKVEILKDKIPSIDNLSVNTDGEKPKISFTVVDEEKTFVSGKITVTDKNGAEIQNPITFEDLNNLTFDIENTEEFGTYNLKIAIKYDFDSDKESEENQEEFITENSFMVQRQHEFGFRDLKVKQITDNKVILEFVSTLKKPEGDKCELQRLMINDQSYDVEKQEDDKYTVEIPYTEKTRTEYKVQKALLNTLHEFDISNENHSVVVFKSVSAVVIPTVVDDTTISVNAKVVDEDNIANNMYVVLSNSKGEIERKAMRSKEETLMFGKPESFDEGTYNVKVFATFDAVDGEEHIDEMLAEENTTIDIKASVIESVEPQYADKNEQIDVTYKLSTNSSSKAETIVVNEIPCKVVEEPEEDTYKVKVTMPSEFGTTDLKVTKINFANGKTVDTTYTSQVEVLKSVKPIVDNLVVDDTQTTPRLSFRITDPEETFISGKIIITDRETVARKEMPFSSLTDISFALDGISEFKEYDIDIEVTYDFDLNKLDSEHQDTEVLAEKTFEIIKDYKFKLEGLTVTEIDRNEKTATLEFTSTNGSQNGKYFVDKVTINGDVYEVSEPIDNKYTVKVPYNAEERKELVLENAELNNLKQFTGLAQKVVIFKTAPKAEVEATLTDGATTITANINMIDKDDTLSEVEAKLLNPKGQLITTKEIDKDAKNVKFTSPETEMLKAGEYTIQIGANYNAVDGLEHNSKEEIGKGTIKVPTKAKITEAVAQSKYVEKGGTVEVKYKIESNNEFVEPSSINISSTSYQLTSNTDGTYSANITAPNTGYGNIAHQVEIVMFGEETVVLESTASTDYYLLKNKPSIENYTFNDKQKEQTITFDIKNEDNAILKDDAKIVIKDENDEIKHSQLLETNNTVELKDLDNGKYTIELDGSYDLDENGDDNDNTHKLSEIFEPREIQVVSHYTANLNITNVDVKDKLTAITFTSTNSSNLDVKKIIVDGNEIEVEKVLNTENTYIAKIPCENEENKVFTITGVVVGENNIQIDFEEEQYQKCEIYKPAPSVTDVTANIMENDVLHIEFKFTDERQIAKNTKVLVKDSQKNTVSSADLTQEAKEAGSIDISGISKAGQYTVEFVSDFDRVDGLKNEQKKINEKEIKFEIEIKPVIKVENITNKYPGKGEEIAITYNITTNTDEQITSITVDGEDYPIQDNSCIINTNAPSVVGDKFYEISKIKVGDQNVEITNSDAKIYVHKDEPTLKDYKLDVDNNRITFRIDNPDDAIISGNAVITTKDGTEKLTQPLNNDENTIDLSSGYDESLIYVLSFNGTCDLGGNPENGINIKQLNDLFKEEDFQLGIQSQLQFDKITNRFPKKSENVDIVFTITSNTSIPVSQINVNDNYYKATPVENEKDKYKITYIAKDEAGYEELKVNKIKHEENEIQVEEKVDKLDVLKQKPEIYQIDEITQNNEEKKLTIKFTLNDVDGAIKENGAYATLDGGKILNDKQEGKVTVNKDKNEITFVNVTENQEYSFEVKATYDLDSDEENSQNSKEEETLLNSDVMLISKDSLNIENVKAENILGKKTNYINRDEEFKLTFTLATSGENYPVSARINGNDYTLVREKDTYTTVEYFDPYNEKGKKEITIENVTLDNNQIINTNVEAEIEVLKNKLNAENITVDTTSGKAVLRYELSDEEDSFVSGRIELRDATTEQKVKDINITDKQTTEYELDVEEYRKYKAELFMKYDLDEDKQDEANQNEESFGTVDVELINDYNLEMSDLKVTKINKESRTATLQFNSENATSYKINKVKIGEQECAVTLMEDGTYTFDYTFEDNNKKEITIDHVILENEKELEVNKNNVVVIFKTAPTSNNINAEVIENNKVKVTFEITDIDSTLTNLYAVLKDENGSVILEQPLSLEARDYTFNNLTANKYKVEIKADYDAVDGEEHAKQSLGESETVEINIDVNIKTKSISKKYPEKQEPITLVYTITSNVEAPVSKIIINDIEFIPEKESENDYSVKYTTKETDGIEELKITRLEFENKMVIDLKDNPHEDIVDVLKTAPKITNVESVDDLENSAVMFKIEVSDPDKAIKSGVAKINDGEQQSSISDGTNNVVFRVSEGVKYTLSIDIDYDLDSNSIEDEQEITNESTLHQQQDFTLLAKYDLIVNDVKTFDKQTEKETKYFAKNSNIQLRFNSTNRTSLEPEKIQVKDLLEEDSEEGTWYTVNSEDDYYYAEINADTKFGLKHLDITAVQLSSGKIINKDEFKEIPDYVEVDILKDKPEIQNFNVSNQENNVTVTFRVIDNDNALLDSYIKIVNNKDEKEAYKQLINVGNNNHEVQLGAGNQYTLTIERNYNLDSVIEDENNKFTGDFKKQIIEIAKEEEPNFIVRNLSISDRVPNGEKVKITFENELISYQEVESIMIDGQSYSVSKDDKNVYSLELDPDYIGTHRLHVESVQMGGKTFKIDRYLRYIYENIVPTINNVDSLEIQEDQTTATAIVNYELNDPNSAIRTLTAYLRNSNGKLAETKVLEDVKGNNLTMSLIKGYKYSIELVAEYDIGDGVTIEKTTLFKKSKEAEPFVGIAEESINKEYVAKGEEVVLKYKFSTNVDQEVRKIFIGDDSYSVTKVIDDNKKVVPDTYEIRMYAPMQSGILEQKVTKVTIGNTPYTVSNDPAPVEIKVLKSDPTLTHFIVDETNQKLTFKLNDEDESLLQDAILTIDDNSGGVTTKELDKDAIDFEFDFSDLNMSTGINYNVSVNATFNLVPTKKLNVLQKMLSAFSGEDEGDSIRTQNIFEKNIKITGDTNYECTFSDNAGYYIFSTDPNDEENRPLEFTFTCNVQSEVEKVIIDGKEYPVVLREGTDNIYRVPSYLPMEFDKYTFEYEKIILKNGIAFEINQTVGLWVRPQTAKFEITEYDEDLENQKVKFTFKATDPDNTIKSNLKFTLKDSQGKVIDTIQEATKNENYVEFNIPNPPTSKYVIEVNAEIMIYDGYTQSQRIYRNEYDSKVTTSILNAKPSTLYPEKGEMISMDYSISSTRIVEINPHDQANLDKAVSITTVTVNGEDYEVENLGNETYRIHYIVQKNAGEEKLNITNVNFSNGESEEVNRTDRIDILKQVPIVEDYHTENNIKDKKVKFSFKISDPDQVLGASTINAEVNGETKPVEVGENNIEFDVESDTALEFKIKATYDLDSDCLNNEYQEENYYQNNEIFTKPFILTGSYDIEFSNIKKYNSKGEETDYFEKNEDIKVSFDFEAKNSLVPESLVIDNQNYTLNKEPESEKTYYLTMKGYENAGIINANINSVKLNSGNVVELNDKKITLEVLKDVISIEDFKYSEDSDNDRIRLDININDKDMSSKVIEANIKDEYGVEIPLTDPSLNIGENSKTFERTGASKYFVTITSTYNRDSNPDDQFNYYQDEQVAFEVVTINTRYIEMKDIMDVEVYRFGDSENAEKVESIKEENLENLNNCLVKVTMRDLPAFYSEITGYEKTDDGKLKLKLAYEDAKVYTSEGLKPLEVTLDILEEENYSYNDTFKNLLERMKTAGPTDKIVLDRDYDLSDYETNNDDSEAVIDFVFRGELDGNGHTISNLHKVLFSSTQDAKIKNLVFKDIEFTKSTNQAVIVKKGSATELTNVHITGVVLNCTSEARNNNALFALELNNNSIVQESSATDIRFNGATYSCANASGVCTLRQSVIKNCYIQGRVTSGWQQNSGLVSNADKNSEISNNIVNVNLSTYFGQNDGSGNGEIVSSPNGVTLKNNLSLLASGHACTIYSNKGNISDNSVNNYQLEESTAVKNQRDGIETISKKDINAEFFRNTLEFSDKIWNIPDDTSFDKLPTLKGATASYTDSGSKPSNPNVYIPDYNRLYKMSDYRSEKEITYHNMYKLMPFYDAKEILTDGNKIKNDEDLTNKLIKFVLAYDNNHKLVTTLTTDNYKKLSKIRVVFEDGTGKDYNIRFDDYYGNIASYIIPELGIGYNFNKYVMDADSSIVKKLVKKVSAYEFTRDLDPVTASISDSRLYKEYFDNVTKKNITEFIENTLVDYEYIPTLDSDVLDNIIEQKLTDSKLKQLLFTYNYFKFWYDLDMNGVEVADTIMFHGKEMFSNRMTIENISANLIKNNNSATNVTSGFYNNYLEKYTGKSNIANFMEYYIYSLTDYKSCNKWFKDNWHGGVLAEFNIKAEDNVEYEFWWHFRNDSNAQNYFLSLFNVPENSMYIVSVPTQLFFGSTRVYVANPDKASDKKEFDKVIENFGVKITRFYQFAYNITAAEYLNRCHGNEFDRRTTKNEKGEEVFNNPNITEEPYHKYFAEPLGKWPAGNGSGAYANGSEVFYVTRNMLTDFEGISHESVHNQDSRIFMKGFARRGGAEDYARGNLEQKWDDGSFTPNLIEDYSKPTGEITTQNWSCTRIDTQPELDDYYQKFFEVNDFLDMLEADAFLTLTSDQKAKIATQVYYPNLTEDVGDKGDSVTGYRRVTKEQMDNIKTREDLWNNRIILKPVIVKDTIVGINNYNMDSVYTTHWYQPHNDTGRPDTASMKYLAWEMAGLAGYDDGYLAYFTNNYLASKGEGTTTDLSALRYVTKKPDITFKEYKLGRYNELEKYRNKKDIYIDAQAVYEEFIKAMQADAESGKRALTNTVGVKKKYLLQIKTLTNDLMTDPFSQNIEIVNNEETPKTINANVSNNKNAIVKNTNESKNTNAIDETSNTVDVTQNTNTENILNTFENEIMINENIVDLFEEKRITTENDIDSFEDGNTIQ